MANIELTESQKRTLMMQGIDPDRASREDIEKILGITIRLEEAGIHISNALNELNNHVREYDFPIIGRIAKVRDGDTIEISGAFGSGKTNLRHTIAAWFVKNTDRNVLYVDTERTFMAKRLKKMCGDDKLLSRIHFVRVESTQKLLDLVSMIDNVKKQYNIGLLIVDSIINPFRAEYVGVKELAERQQLLNFCMQTMKRVMNDGVLIITNQMVANPISFAHNQPAGGNIMGHFATLRFMITKEGQKRTLKLIDAPHLAPCHVQFRITDEGCKVVRKRERKGDNT